jgi:hypothetical protein
LFITYILSGCSKEKDNGSEYLRDDNIAISIAKNYLKTNFPSSYRRYNLLSISSKQRPGYYSLYYFGGADDHFVMFINITNKLVIMVGHPFEIKDLIEVK